MKKYKRYLITSALPYANGPIHIGHLAGVYVPSDIFTRYLRMKGEDVVSICGSDEHGVPITLKARNEEFTPQEIVDRYHAITRRHLRISELHSIFIHAHQIRSIMRQLQIFS